jgi:uncharacterized protein
MFFDIKQLELGKILFDKTYAPGVIEFFDPQLRQIDPIKSSGTAELKQALKEIRVVGHVNTRMEAACDRCLETISIPVDAEFDLINRPESYMPEAEELEVPASEAGIGFYQGDGIDLKDILREQILLALPMHRICREDCKGICPVCGQNRNTAECACRQEPTDDRWSALKNL